MSNEPRVIPDEGGYVKTKNLFSYAVGLAGQNMTYSYISGWLFYYCASVLKIAPKTVGYITSITRAWDSVNDPIIGAMVDKHRFKNGEKLRPYLVYLPPVIGILSALMFINFGLSPMATVVLIFVEYLLWDLFYSVQDVALWGMVAVSSPSSKERAKVSQWVTIGAGAGSIIAGAFQMIRSFVSGTFGWDDVTVFAVFALVFGLGGELLSMSAHSMKEMVETPKTNESIFEAIFVLRHNKTLLLISLARFLSSVTSSLLPWAYFFESRESFDFGFASFDGGTSQVVYGILMGAPGAIAIFFATKISDKVGGMKRILIIAQGISIVLRTISYFVGFESVGAIYVVCALMAIVAIPSNMMDVAHRSLTSDSIDYVEYKTGKRTEGISFSIQNFITKIASAVNLLLSGLILDWIKYDGSLKNHQQGPLYMKWQWPIFMLGPVIGQILYVIVIMFVKDDKEQRAFIESELKKRRELMAQKEEKINA
ncbi:MAG: MFS transporter [Clostridia bacterium]|nr:MFS transporter [Clostridia bacterium]